MCDIKLGAVPVDAIEEKKEEEEIVAQGEGPKCNGCGTVNRVSANYCDNCGTKL